MTETLAFVHKQLGLDARHSCRLAKSGVNVTTVFGGTT